MKVRDPIPQGGKKKKSAQSEQTGAVFQRVHPLPGEPQTENVQKRMVNMIQTRAKWRPRTTSVLRHILVAYTTLQRNLSQCLKLGPFTEILISSFPWGKNSEAMRQRTQFPVYPQWPRTEQYCLCVPAHQSPHYTVPSAKVKGQLLLTPPLHCFSYSRESFSYIFSIEGWKTKK